MKKLALSVLAFAIGIISYSQQRNIPPTYDNREDQPMENGFKKENLFLGGSIALGLGNSSFNIGATPEIGYSLNKWLDAGIPVNLNYYSQSYNDGYNNYKYRSFNYGTGVFGRAWVLPYLYFQVQPEINWVTRNYDDYGNIIPYTTSQSGSLLLGIGYGSRIIGSHYTYFTLMFDVAGDKNSPYLDATGSVYPIIRAGFGFYLHPTKGRR